MIFDKKKWDHHFLNQWEILENGGDGWYVVSCGSKNGYLKDMCWNELWQMFY